MNFRFLIFCFFLVSPTWPGAMDFTIERLDLRPIRPPTLHIKATGEIRPGDTEKLKAVIASAEMSDVRDVHFMFDSPGGALMESLELGSYIAEIPAVVSAQVGGREAEGAVCASACVYAYLGADYRYLSTDARLGIHRFGLYDVELDGNEGAALGQALSGLLSEYIRTHRVEPEFFEAISAIDHDDILWLPKRTLEKWRVITNDVYDEQAAYINVNGDIALRMKQIAITGDSFLTIFCTANGISGLANLHEPEIAAYGRFELAVDGSWLPIQRWDVVDRSNARGRIVFDMPSEIARAAINADSIGARVVAPSGDIFFGFEQRVRDDLVAEMIRGCPGSLQPAPQAMVEQTRVDFPGNDITTDGIRGISFARCKQICLEYEECRAVTYVQSKSWCWPKSRITQRVPRKGMISAYKR